MNESERKTGVRQHSAHNFARVCDAFVKTAFVKPLMMDKHQLGVENEDMNFFVIQGLHFEPKILKEEFRAFKWHVAQGLTCGATSKLERGGKHCGLRGAESFVFGEIRRAAAREITKAAAGGEDALPDLDGILALHARVDEEAEQFSVRQRSRPKPQEPLARAVFFGNVVDALGHAKVATTSHHRTALVEKLVEIRGDLDERRLVRCACE